jgi:YbbR domain-containing protein
VSVLPRVVARNWRLKVAALLLSIFLWALVSLQPGSRSVLSAVPVRVDVMDPAWTLADLPSPATVTVQLGGSARELLTRGGEAAIVRVPIERVIGRDTLVRLRPDWVILSGSTGLIVESISPPTVAIRLEPTLSTAIPLSLGTSNQLPADLALGQPLGLNPTVVRVHGPEHVIEALDSVALEPLDLSSITASGLYRVPVDTTGLSGVTFDPPAAQVSIRVAPAVEREIASVPVVLELPLGLDSLELAVEPSTIPVRLHGVATLVNQVDTVAMAAVIAASHLEGMPAGASWTVPIRLRGVPGLVRAFSAVDSVVVVRRAPVAAVAPR